MGLAVVRQPHREYVEIAVLHAPFHALCRERTIQFDH
jgi:hypothetical protein